MAVSYNGYNVKCITMEKNENADLKVGDLAVINAAGQLVAGGTGNPFVGVITAVRDNFVTVQTEGYVEVSYTGTINNGVAELDCSNAGAVKVATSTTTAHRAYRVLKVNSADKVVGFLL